MGGSVTYEDNGIDKIHYTYDSSGKLISMNLNGAEYYYVRNAQGDIIGLINAQGEKVVSYTYDSWGKLISIEGSLKDTVGEKNPYRYRGYRYDSETGLYYLQNRYYNPEWGRFINADGIIGETGELLGHNLFAYSKNNCANMSDYSGFRPVYTLGEETEAMRAASYAVMNRTRTSRASGIANSFHPSVSNLGATIYGTATSIVGDISKTVRGYVDKNSIVSILPKTSIAQKIQPYARAANKLSKAFTVITTALDINSTWDPSVKMPTWKRVLKTGLQVGGVVACAYVGAHISGPLLAKGMLAGGYKVAGAIVGSTGIDYLAGKAIGATQNFLYKKFGME
ncbi:RHS repeat-associated core domain-containing protein [Haloimpatiens lingqiaonensis]|uniref:RHS repeat-associated core domain-containing protein n=1 Tax=Haloimpatiens lingqiaonensis TaxID=1380675 RepID=UPI001FA94C62|nr:RHS repeat-associated core domain-containing protein [Haloimpatiens lingqiaonensis]